MSKNGAGTGLAVKASQSIDRIVGHPSLHSSTDAGSIALMLPERFFGACDHRIVI